MLQRLFAAFLLCALTGIAFAEDTQTLTRRDGFLMIWEAIDRPAEETNEIPFEDVPEGDRGFLEITYAKRRGLLDDDSNFSPDKPLTMGEALIWLLRTRNVADPEEITLHLLPEWLQRYPIASIDVVAQPVSSEQLRSMMQQFDTLLQDEVHEVSLYSEKFHGKGTAFGETFDMYAMTAAHRTFPYNTIVRVTNVENGKSVTVRINDRGPFVEGRDMDLSLGAFTTIAERSKGVIRARFERMGTSIEATDATDESEETEEPEVAPVVPPCPAPGSYFQRIGGGVALHRMIPNVLPLGKELRLSAPRAFVVRSVVGPDGERIARQDFVLPGDVYVFRPSTEGEYLLTLRGASGRRSLLMPIRFLRCNEE